MHYLHDLPFQHQSGKAVGGTSVLEVKKLKVSFPPLEVTGLRGIWTWFCVTPEPVV